MGCGRTVSESATATAILAATSRVTVGIGLLPVPLRNVALTAMEIATMARLFPGRLTAGVGHGVRDWMSQVGNRKPRDRPEAEVSNNCYTIDL